VPVLEAMAWLRVPALKFWKATAWLSVPSSGSSGSDGWLSVPALEVLEASLA